jgi:hypothetical protein
VAVLVAACAEARDKLASRVKTMPVLALIKHSRRRTIPVGVG